MLERLLGKKIPVEYGNWRPGDQRIYVSDIRKAEQELGWHPSFNVEEGVRKLVDWVLAHGQYFS